MTPADGALPLDEEGLLCALVLVPSTYSRNRFFRLYEHPAMRAVQRRASPRRRSASDRERTCARPRVLTFPS